VDLLSDFWGGDFHANQTYLRWKYTDNPYTEIPLAIVAIHHGVVRGFRGYFAARWHIPGEDIETVVLSPGDTFVHPDHRGSRLSLSMGTMAMKEYASHYKVFLNLGASRSSVPGYLKMGFVPLTVKTYLNKYSLRGVLEFFIKSGRKKKSFREIPRGEFDNVLVENTPRPEEMYHVISRQAISGQRLTLLQDTSFFRWRFNNALRNYLFCYQRENGKTTGYLVVRMSPGGDRGYIIDYAAADNASLENMVRVLARTAHFDVLSILDMDLTDDFRLLLKRAGFKAGGLMRMAEKKIRGEWPLLVRPVRQDCTEDDWFIGGLDIRQGRSWKIKGICADGV
jgi:hypothetical protein